MAVDFRDESFPILKEYLFYQQTVRQKSPKTVDEYFLDLRMFFRFMKVFRKLVPKDTEFEDIKIDDIDLDFLKKIDLTDAYEYMNYLQRERGLNASSRASPRKSIIFLPTRSRSLNFPKRKRLCQSTSPWSRALSF